MTANRLCQRTLSAFKPSKQLWVPVQSSRSCSVQKQHLTRPPSHFTLVTQNLDAFSPRPIARAKLLLDDILSEESRLDIIFLQEVTLDVHATILRNSKVRQAFLVTDAEDQTSFEGVPFANMTLLSRKRFFNFDRDGKEEVGKFVLGPVSRVSLPSKYRRCALSVDITSSGTPTTYRLINVHLDSLNTFHFRSAQMEILANLLRDGCGGGVIAGDFNAISPEDHLLLEKNGLVDAWVAVHGDNEKGATWGVGAERSDGLKAGRLDKVALSGVEARAMEVLRPRMIEVPKPGRVSDYMPCSDHCRLRLGFTL